MRYQEHALQGLLMCVCMAFVLPEGSAQTTQELSEASQQALLVHLREAREAYESGEYERALTSYESAYRIKALPSIWFFRAQILERLDRLDEALHAYDRFIEMAPDDERVPLATRLRELLQSKIEARERAQRAMLRIITSPSGATVSWQDKDRVAHQRQTPLLVQAEAGDTITFTVQRDGFTPVQRDFTFEQGQTQLWEPSLDEVSHHDLQTQAHHTFATSHVPRVWLAGAAAGAILSVTGFTIAARSDSQLDDADDQRGVPGSTRPDNYDALHKRYNRALGVGWSGLVGAVACGAMATWTWRTSTTHASWRLQPMIGHRSALISGQIEF